MNTLHNNRLNILDLPNEILFRIVKKLNIVDVFYSLVDIDERFFQMVLDPLYNRNLNMTVMTMNSFFDRTFSIDDQILSSICEKILPQIHGQINKLVVEQHSMEHILTMNYPQLYSLSLLNFQEKILFQYLTDSSILRDLLSQQITHLNIDIQNEPTSELSEILSNIFALILSLSKQLISLNFCQLFSYREKPIFISKLSTTNCISLTLTELKINVATFDDCLYLLDGRLDCLSKLIINIEDIRFKRLDTNDKKKLPKLKYFSLTTEEFCDCYDELIITLIHRMINLEQLILFLHVLRDNFICVDGIQLYNDILMYMPRLNKFIFNINTGDEIEDDNNTDFSFNEEAIQRSFSRREFGQVGSYIHVDRIMGGARCHVYSLPYEFENFIYLSNAFHFQNGMFDKVRCLKMGDSRPFEHEFFKLISQNFPFLKQLYVYNLVPQKDKQHSSTLIIFPHLILLYLVYTHVDYAKQFLFNRKTHLPCLLDLCITYESLTMLTNNFTNDATRLNCMKLKNLHINNPFVRPKAFHKYFPLL